jgi:Beta-1,3-glucanase
LAACGGNGLLTGPWCMDTPSFYQDATTNYYAKYMHEKSYDKLGYAFQSDDHCNQSDFVAVVNPRDFTITFHNS